MVQKGGTRLFYCKISSRLAEILILVPADRRDHRPDCLNAILWGVTQPKLVYTGCPRRNVPDFGRVFLMLKYTDITQNTYVQS